MSEEQKKLIEAHTLLSDWYDRDRNAKGDDYSFTHAGNLYRLMNDDEKRNLIHSIVDLMLTPGKEINDDLLQLCYWFRADMNLGMAVAYGLNLDMKEVMKQVPQLNSF